LAASVPEPAPILLPSSEPGWGNFVFKGFHNAIDVRWWQHNVDSFLGIFDPTKLLIRPHPTSLARGPRAQDNTGPLFAECMRAILALLQQHVRLDSGALTYHRHYPMLLMLTQCLPILLLRWNRSFAPDRNARQQQGWCKQFLRGNWISLYNSTVESLNLQNARQRASIVFNPQSQPGADQRRWDEAKDFIQAGCTGKARARILRNDGGHSQTATEVLSSLRGLHPTEPPPPPLGFSSNTRFDWITGSWLAKLIRSNAMRVAHDQFG